MTRIDFGLILPLPCRGESRPEQFVESLHRAFGMIEGHFSSLHNIDHLMDNRDRGFIDLESFTTLAYLAGLHPQFKFGHTVICQSFRNPALLAKMAATLQFLSGGRFLLGIGAGGNEAESRAYGYDYSSNKTRVEQLEEALQIIRALWSQEQVTFSGVHYRVDGAVCEPRPNPPPPIMIGAFRPKMLRITAQYADEWNVSSTGIEKYTRLVADFERACTEVSRDPAAVRRSWGGGCICRSDPAEAARVAGDRYNSDPPDDFDFVGTPAQILAKMRPFIDLGVCTFLVDCGGFPDLTTLELLVREVIPALND